MMKTLILVLMGYKKTPSFEGGEGVESTPAPFLFVKTIEKVISLRTVLIFYEWQF